MNVLQNVKSDGLSRRARIWIHVHDNPADRLSSLDLIPYFAGQLVQTGVDVYMPATTPPDGTITFWNAPRGDTSQPAGAEHAELGLRRAQDLGPIQRLCPRHQHLGRVQEGEAEPLQAGQAVSPDRRRKVRVNWAEPSGSTTGAR